FHGPLDRVAREPVLPAQGRDVPVFHAAQPTLRAGPERPIFVEAQGVDGALAEAIRGGKRCLDLAVLEIGDTSVVPSNPEPALRVVRPQGGGEALAPQPPPGNLLDLCSVRQPKQAVLQAGEPEFPSRAPGDGAYVPAGHTGRGDE